jgi:hypothetical protein
MIMMMVLTTMKIKCSTFGKEEREKQNRLKAKVKLKRAIWFC